MLPPLKIDWESSPDGHHHKKVSTVHGWLAKMRGTLLGNERLRSRGMREMKEAKAIRKYKRDRKAEQRALASRRTGIGAGTGTGWFTFGKRKGPAIKDRKKSVSVKAGSGRRTGFNRAVGIQQRARDGSRLSRRPTISKGTPVTRRRNTGGRQRQITTAKPQGK